MLKNGLGVLVASVALAACARQSSRASAACLQIGQPVQLSGVYADSQAYGPPGFGETPAKDAKWQIPILVLNKPFSVCSGAASDSAGRVTSAMSRVELDFSKNPAASLPPVGEDIVVHGRLERRSTISQITDPILTVDSLVHQNGKME